MEKKLLVKMIIISAIAIAGVGGSIVEYKQVLNLQASNNALTKRSQDRKKELLLNQSKLAQTESSLQTAKDTQAKTQAQINNKSANADVLQKFNQTSIKLMQVLYSYSPSTFKKRSSVAKDYLSSKAYSSFFPSTNDSGDASYITSTADKINIYNKAVQGDKISGLITVQYQSKYKDQAFNKGQAFYEVTFDVSSNKVTSIKQIDNKSLSNNEAD